MGREYGRRRSSWRERGSNELPTTGTQGLLFYLLIFWFDFGWQFDHQDWLLPPLTHTSIEAEFFWLYFEYSHFGVKTTCPKVI